VIAISIEEINLPLNSIKWLKESAWWFEETPFGVIQLFDSCIKYHPIGYGCCCWSGN